MNNFFVLLFQNWPGFDLEVSQFSFEITIARNNKSFYQK